MDIALNNSWTGSHIHTTPEYQKGPRSESGFPWTQSAWKDVAKFLNYTGGGGRRHSSYFDMYPEDLEYLAKEYAGGQVRFIENMAKVLAPPEGKTASAADVPIARVFYGDDYDKANQALKRERKIEEKRPWEGPVEHAKKPLIDLGQTFGLQ